MFLQLAFHTSAAEAVRQAGSAIGMTAAVEPNPYSDLAQQLAVKESELSSRERAVAQQEEIAAASAEARRTAEQVTLTYLGFGGGFLLVLIAVNYYFDYRRKQRFDLSRAAQASRP